jgi:hypothetical protein
MPGFWDHVNPYLSPPGRLPREPTDAEERMLELRHDQEWEETQFLMSLPEADGYLDRDHYDAQKDREAEARLDPEGRD